MFLHPQPDGRSGERVVGDVGDGVAEVLTWHCPLVHDDLQVPTSVRAGQRHRPLSLM